METLYLLGKPFVHPPGNHIAQCLRESREWDWFLRLVLPALLKEKEPTICEVGSNIGASLRQILVAKPRATVLAFEPSDHFRPYLLRNIEFAEASDRVRVYPYLLGREEGIKSLYYNHSTASAVGLRSFPYHELPEEQIVEMLTLDAVLAGERVDFIKVDTDGLEFEVLQGAVNTLRGSKPSLHFEFTPYLYSDPLQNLIWIQKQGYKHLLCLTRIGDPIGITDDPSEALKWAQEEAFRYCDIVTCAEGSKAEARLLSWTLLLSLKLHSQKHRLKRVYPTYRRRLKRKITRFPRRLRRKTTRLWRKSISLGRR